jgi:predicted HicB family RNase H-like nuclease
MSKQSIESRAQELLIYRLIDSLPEPAVGPQRPEYSGKFNVRVPKSLHAALASEAEAEGVSLNQLVVAKLALHLQVR